MPFISPDRKRPIPGVSGDSRSYLTREVQTGNPYLTEWGKTGGLSNWRGEGEDLSLGSDRYGGMSSETIPMDWVIGAEEVTAWMWPDSPKPSTVRFSIHEWAKIERAAKIEGYDSVEGYISKVVTADVEEHGEKLSG